jgi:hypothetical protein
VPDGLSVPAAGEGEGSEPGSPLGAAAGALAVLDGGFNAAAAAAWPGEPACMNLVAPEGTTTIPIFAASASTRLPAESCEFSIARAAF